MEKVTLRIKGEEWGLNVVQFCSAISNALLPNKEVKK